MVHGKFKYKSFGSVTRNEVARRLVVVGDYVFEASLYRRTGADFDFENI